MMAIDKLHKAMNVVKDASIAQRDALTVFFKYPNRLTANDAISASETSVAAFCNLLDAMDEAHQPISQKETPVTREELVKAVDLARNTLTEAQIALAVFDAAPENNVYPTIDKAIDAINDKLRDEAVQDCEGSYNCGQEKYFQEFMVGGVTYIGELRCEYGRHDKTFYFLDFSEFSYTEKR